MMDRQSWEWYSNAEIERLLEGRTDLGVKVFLALAFRIMAEEI